MSTLLKRKTQGYALSKQQDKQQLQGWNIDIDDFAASNNLLKILEKKITFPAIQNADAKKRVNKKLQTLPSVIQYPKRHKLQRNVITQDDMNMHPLMQIQKTKKLQKETTPSVTQTLLKKSKTQKAIQNINRQKMQKIEQNNPIGIQSAIPSIKQIKASVPSFNRSHFQFRQSKQKEEHLASIKKILRGNHKKIASVQAVFPSKKALHIIQQPIKQEQKYIPKVRQSKQFKQLKEVKQRKSIRWDRFNVSQQKFVVGIVEPRSTKQKKQKIIKIKQKIRKHKEQELTHMSLMQKILDKSKLVTHIQQKQKNIKTQATYYFMDDHLQSPYQTKSRHQN